MAMTESVLAQPGLKEMMAEIQEMNEKMTTSQGNWEAAISKLQVFDSEVAKVQAQMQVMI